MVLKNQVLIMSICVAVMAAVCLFLLLAKPQDISSMLSLIMLQNVILIFMFVHLDSKLSK